MKNLKENINLLLDYNTDGERTHCQECIHEEFEFDEYEKLPEEMTDEELLDFGKTHNFEHIFLTMLEIRKQLEEL